MTVAMVLDTSAALACIPTASPERRPDGGGRIIDINLNDDWPKWSG